MKKAFGVVHSVWVCDDCGKEFSGYKNAQALAAKHARHYGHKVSGEVGIAGYYDAKGDKKNAPIE